MRNFGIKTSRIASGNQPRPGSPAPNTTQRNNILQFARRDISLPFRVDYRDSSLGPFIPGSILIPRDAALPPSKLFQTMVDIGALCFWGFLTLLLAVAIYGAIFLLLFFAAY